MGSRCRSASLPPRMGRGVSAMGCVHVCGGEKYCETILYEELSPSTHPCRVPVSVSVTVHTHTRAHTHTHARTHARTHTHTHIRARARTHTHTHTHTNVGIEVSVGLQGDEDPLVCYVGLENELLIRVHVDAASGELSKDFRCRFLGARSRPDSTQALKLIPVAAQGLPAVLALCSRPWLCYAHQVRLDPACLRPSPQPPPPSHPRKVERRACALSCH